MCTGMESGKQDGVTPAVQRGETPSCLTTTLYDLIAGLQAVVGSDNDALVVAAVRHLLRSGRLTFPRKARPERRIRLWEY
jgi:hypothetical protein